ncbi:lamin tail domain-containing protein [Streptomyces sp. NPDC051322]|uniref:lamin tail domain-containing protein n=1 Tax=Streptomyces sp. NPDC051322 TaxID=3154645 RepID=UPI00344E12BE
MSSLPSLSSGSRLAAAVLASGALLAAAFPAAASDHHHPAPRHERAAIDLSGVHFETHHRGQRADLGTEWISVTNKTHRAVNLKNWTLSDSQHHTYRFHALRLGAHKSVKVHTGFGRDNARNVYQDRRSSVWDKAGDRATLRDARGHVVDTVSWGRRHR